MKRQTGRIVESSSSLSLLYALLPLMIEAAGGRAQYASPYGNAYAIPTTNYAPPPEVQSIWSGSPIIVNDNQYRAQEQQQYPKNNGYYGEETYRQPPYPEWRREELPATRAPNHNYNNVPGYFYYQQQDTTPTPHFQYNQPSLAQPYPPSSSELVSSDSRREEEQVVQIGGSRTLATNNYQNIYNNNDENFYEPAQPWRRRDFQAKYAQHYAEYLRKYPRRLQPVYNTSEDFEEK
ncbi:uncharacterized protein LOC108035240 [Drosophila biarmipes]|uniref:uncharacterized protein LOC108035240 n=1 Tax=Drosophila biarmipes TaxID=125945 RepID=UPI0007E6100E|nr:uncharacterized protein LOC108035240 [Drosophila biarmipes]